MARRDPFKEIEELFEQFNDGFPDMSEELGEQLGGSGGIHLDVGDTGEKLVVTADVPGFDPEDIDVSVQDRRLTISAEHDETAEDDDTHYYRRERTTHAAKRTVTLPADVDESAASASYENGVLTVTLPKQSDGEAGIDIQVD